MNKNVYKYDDMKRKEHMAVRTTAGWYVWTHQLVEVTGEDAAKFLDYIYTNPISNLKIGSERYTTSLNKKAEILDDVVIFRMDESKYWISTLFASKSIQWMAANMEGYQVRFEDITSRYFLPPALRKSPHFL